MLQKPNFLVLDEPTNHLDLESINALNIALQKYEGTVLLVTHDDDLLDEVATRIWHFDAGNIEDFKGTVRRISGPRPNPRTRNRQSPQVTRLYWRTVIPNPRILRLRDLLFSWAHAEP